MQQTHDWEVIILFSRKYTTTTTMRGSPQPHQQQARQRLAPRLQTSVEGKGSSTATAAFRQRNMLQFRLPVRPRMRSKSLTVVVQSMTQFKDAVSEDNVKIIFGENYKHGDRMQVPR